MYTPQELRLDRDVHCFAVVCDGREIKWFSEGKCAVNSAIDLMERARLGGYKTKIEIRLPSGQLVDPKG